MRTCAAASRSSWEGQTVQGSLLPSQPKRCSPSTTPRTRSRCSSACSPPTASSGSWTCAQCRGRHNPPVRPGRVASLAAAGISYRWAKELGGLRHAHKDSVNLGWRNASFRGYADYMQTPEFAQAVEALVKEGEGDDLAIMCAEAVPWRCHRSLIGDALLVRGVRVLDIMSADKSTPHSLTKFAVVEGSRVTYPAPAGSQATGQS
ncbi:MAG: DUF488 domain-containing protein [Trueperaceae bacterium]|nr:DUF488 domain-containing protein [Trueperaceae bacterium]